MSKALEDSKDEQVTETAKFVSMMDKLFDCFNVHSFDAGKLQRKSFQDPYYKVTDFRLKVIAVYYITMVNNHILISCCLLVA